VWRLVDEPGRCVLACCGPGSLGGEETGVFAGGDERPSGWFDARGDHEVAEDLPLEADEDVFAAGDLDSEAFPDVAGPGVAGFRGVVGVRGADLDVITGVGGGFVGEAVEIGEVLADPGGAAGEAVEAVLE
jgi:hypothetical protein